MHVDRGACATLARRDARGSRLTCEGVDFERRQDLVPRRYLQQAQKRGDEFEKLSIIKRQKRAFRDMHAPTDHPEPSSRKNGKCARREARKKDNQQGVVLRTEPSEYKNHVGSFALL